MTRLRLAALAVTPVVLLLFGLPAAARAAPPVCTDVDLVVPMNADYLLPTTQCTDPDGGMIQGAMLVTGPSHGTVTPEADGYHYAPQHDYRGDDEFTYTVSDSNMETSQQPATMRIHVDAPPTCDDGTATVQSGRQLRFSDLPCDDLDGDGLDIDISDPDHGTIDVLQDGTIVYTAPAGYTGPDEFGYQATDDPYGLSSEPATMSITVTAPPAVTPSPTPTPTPSPTPTVVPAPRDTTAPAFSVRAAKAKLKRALARGLKLTVTTDEGATAKATVTVDRATARKLRLNRRAKRPVTVASATRAVTSGHPSLVMKFTSKARRALKKAHRLKLQVRITMTDAAGNAATHTVRITLRR